MALLPKSLIRPVALQKIPDMIKQGLSPTGIINQLKSQALTYRRTVMLADIRLAMGNEGKKDRIKYIRKDRIPSASVVEQKDWDFDDKYMYSLKVQTVGTRDDKPGERMVTIFSDKLMSAQQVEEELIERWGYVERYKEERPTGVTVERIVEKIPPFELPFD